jgi:membrane-associated protein
LARFVPVVRTFSPVLAGVGAMRHRLFTTFNVVGGLVWGTGVPLLGFALGKRFPSLKDNIDLVALVIIAVSVLPIGIEAWRHRASRTA